MGWFLRKSFRFGPLRFNLSKSGVGVSAGVKGARVGVDSRGKPYVAGGRGGFYFRKSLSGVEPAPSSEQLPETLRPYVPWTLALAVLVIMLAVQFQRETCVVVNILFEVFQRRGAGCEPRQPAFGQYFWPIFALAAIL